MRQYLRLTYSELQALPPEDYAVVCWLQNQVQETDGAKNDDVAKIHEAILEHITPHGG